MAGLGLERTDSNQPNLRDIERSYSRSSFAEKELALLPD